MRKNLFIVTIMLMMLACNLDNSDILDGEVIYNSFESDSGWWSWPNGYSEATLSSGDEPVHSGNHSLKLITDFKDLTGDDIKWVGTGGPDQTVSYNIDLNPFLVNNALEFWIYSMPSNKDDQEVQVDFYDLGDHAVNSVKIKPSKKAAYKEWTRLEVLFSDIEEWVDPDNSDNVGDTLDLHGIEKIQFSFEYSGTYFIDDIVAKNRINSNFDDDIFNN